MSGWEEFPNLASERLGAVVLWASDDFFAARENLIRDAAAEWREHEYTDRGKWMDGWESRRKRAIGPDVEDAAIVRLAMPGVIRAIVVDTAFFRGNFPEQCAIEGTSAREGTLVDSLLSTDTEWVEVVPRSPLRGDSKNVFEPRCDVALTHLRLRIFPDGGIARLRVHASPAPDWVRIGGASSSIDLAALESGGEVLACSDMFFGPKHNLIQPGRARNMSDGWETKRRRGVTSETHDWVLVKLAGQGTLDRVELDTAFFLGNFPDTAMLEGCDGDPETAVFRPVFARRKLMGHTRHFLANEIEDRGPFTHLRLKVFPDGGVSRLRAFGKLTEPARADAAARMLATSSPRDLEARLRACCTASRFVAAMTKERPFASGEKLLARAREIVSAFGEVDVLEAVAGHPRIGDKSRERFSSEEQSRARAGSAETLAAIAEANRAYETKHGFVFLIYATGKTADEILAAARARLQNTREIELKTAAKELAEITALRLRKLVL
ncbi:MAG TPA: allantoicase [Polyangiaceae bacterium]